MENNNVKYAKTFLAINQMGKNVIAKSKKNLSKKTKKVSASGRGYTSKIDNSGKLTSSLKAIPNKDGLTFEMLDYGEYVNDGRKPGKFIPVMAMRKWVKSKGIKPRDEKGRFTQRTPQAMKSLAYLLNKGIHDHGIKATHFFSDPFEEELKKLENKLPKAIEQDLDIILNIK